LNFLRKKENKSKKEMKKMEEMEKKIALNKMKNLEEKFRVVEPKKRSKTIKINLGIKLNPEGHTNVGSS